MPDDIESAFWESAKCRESIGEAYENLYYTPVFSLISIQDLLHVSLCHSQRSYHPLQLLQIWS